MTDHDLDTTITEPPLANGSGRSSPGSAEGWTPMRCSGRSRRRTAIDFAGEPLGAPWDAVDVKADPDWVWRSAADDSADALYSLWRDAVNRSRATLGRLLASGGVDQPSKYVFKSTGESPNLRRVLVDIHDEYARHVGHADLLREAIHALTGEDPPQR